jgi:hypothetical protein
VEFSGAELVVAALSILVGWYAGIRKERLSISQYRLSASAFASDWFRDLRAWASEAIDVLSEAAYNAPGSTDPTPMPADVRTRCRHRLSALIDRGRFFLPNLRPDAKGAEKPSAFRGTRHAALDQLVLAEQVLAGTPLEGKEYPSMRAALVAIKRDFVAEIQDILDPRSQNAMIGEILQADRGRERESGSAPL